MKIINNIKEKDNLKLKEIITNIILKINNLSKDNNEI